MSHHVSYSSKRSLKKMGAAALVGLCDVKNVCFGKKKLTTGCSSGKTIRENVANTNGCPRFRYLYNTEVDYSGSKDGKLDILVNNAFQDPAQKDPKSDSLLSKAGFCVENDTVQP